MPTLNNKSIVQAQGITKTYDSVVEALIFEDNVGYIGCALDVSGNATIHGTLKVAEGSTLTKQWGFLYTADFGNIAVTGSITAVSAVDVAASGAAIGDTVLAVPIGSLDDKLMWGAAVFSAGNVHLTARQNGSGAYDPGAIQFRIQLQRWA